MWRSVNVQARVTRGIYVKVALSFTRRLKFAPYRFFIVPFSSRENGIEDIHRDNPPQSNWFFLTVDPYTSVGGLVYRYDEDTAPLCGFLVAPIVGQFLIYK